MGTNPARTPRQRSQRQNSNFQTNNHETTQTSWYDTKTRDKKPVQTGLVPSPRAMEPRTPKIQVVMNSLFSPAFCCPSRRKNIPRSSQVLLPNESRIDFAIKLSRKTILYPLSILIKEGKILQDPTLRYAYHIRTSMQHTWTGPTVGYMHTYTSNKHLRVRGAIN
jgi:hypothetical protein